MAAKPGEVLSVLVVPKVRERCRDKLATAAEAGVVRVRQDLFAVLQAAAGENDSEYKQAGRGCHFAKERWENNGHIRFSCKMQTDEQS